MKHTDFLIDSQSKTLKNQADKIASLEKELHDMKLALENEKLAKGSRASLSDDEKDKLIALLNEKLLKANKEVDKANRKVEKAELKAKKAEKALATALNKIDALINATLDHDVFMIEKLRKEIFGCSSEKTSYLNKEENNTNPLDEEAKNSSSTKDTFEDKKVKDRTGSTPGRKMDTLNFSSWKKGSYEEKEYDFDPNHVKNPQTNLYGKVISVTPHDKIVRKTVKVIRERYYVLTCVQEDGTKFEVQTRDPDCFGLLSCTPSLVANLLTDKYQYFLPSTRIFDMYLSFGTPISTPLINKYMIKGTDLLKDIVDKLHDELISTAKDLHGDETTFLNLQNKTNEVNYIWLLSSGKFDSNKIALYFYFDDRKYEHAKDIIKNYKGTLSSDAYGAYLTLDLINALCWSHARRKLFEYLSIRGKYGKDSKDYKEISELFELTNRIFENERIFKKENLTIDEIKEQRRKETKPIVDEFFLKAKKIYAKDKSDDKNKALAYIIEKEDKFRTFLDYGYVSPHNNLAERFCRKVKLLTNNSLFSATDDGAKSACLALSIIQTCKLNLLDPYRYLNYIFTNYEEVRNDPKKYLPTAKLPQELYYSKKEIDKQIEDIKEMKEEDKI